MSGRISNHDLAELKEQFKPLIGQRFRSLSLPVAAIAAFEPSQVGTIVGVLMDALIPHLDIKKLGLEKHEGILGEREGYPDYKHESGKRLELKLLYVDNPSLKMKKPPTPREPSARLTLDMSAYGRKESEGKDFNEDTNFGKLKRIPNPELQSFLAKHKPPKGAK